MAAAHLKPVGLYYHFGVVDDVEDVLEKHKIATKSSFGTRSSVMKTPAPDAAADMSNDVRKNVSLNESEIQNAFIW